VSQNPRFVERADPAVRHTPCLARRPRGARIWAVTDNNHDVPHTRGVHHWSTSGSRRRSRSGRIELGRHRYDADGLFDADDSCPNIADDGNDSDADGLNDACDPTPLPASPPTFDPTDLTVRLASTARTTTSETIAVTVINNGPSVASAPNLAIDIPGTVLNLPPRCTQTLQTLQCSIGDLAPGQGLRLTFILTASGTLTASAASTSERQLEDLNPSNNSASITLKGPLRYITIGIGGAAGGPVDAPPVINTGKAGRTYPLRWRLKTLNGQFVTNLSAVRSVAYKPTACSNFAGDPSDALGADTPGNTALTIVTGTTYAYNWKTPTQPGCYILFVTLDDEQILTANFNLT
jgi:Domain of unknown function DUF11